MKEILERYDDDRERITTDEAVDEILKLVEEMVPETLNGFENINFEALDNHEEIRSYGVHSGWNGCRQEFLTNLGVLNEDHS